MNCTSSGAAAPHSGAAPAPAAAQDYENPLSDPISSPAPAPTAAATAAAAAVGSWVADHFVALGK